MEMQTKRNRRKMVICTICAFLATLVAIYSLNAYVKYDNCQSDIALVEAQIAESGTTDDLLNQLYQCNETLNGYTQSNIIIRALFNTESQSARQALKVVIFVVCLLLFFSAILCFFLVDKYSGEKKEHQNGDFYIKTYYDENGKKHHQICVYYDEDDDDYYKYVREGLHIKE